jgi:hypothetical protein
MPLHRRSDGVAITAIYELPVPIWISTDVLGERIRTGFGPITFDVVMPTQDGAVGGTPTASGVLVPTHGDGSELLIWTQRFAAFPSDPNSTALCRVVVQTVVLRSFDAEGLPDVDLPVDGIDGVWLGRSPAPAIVGGYVWLRGSGWSQFVASRNELLAQ